MTPTKPDHAQVAREIYDLVYDNVDRDGEIDNPNLVNKILTEIAAALDQAFERGRASVHRQLPPWAQAESYWLGIKGDEFPSKSPIYAFYLWIKERLTATPKERSATEPPAVSKEPTCKE